MNREVRWHPRKWVSRLVRVLVFVVPLILGVAAATIFARLLPRYDSLVGGIAWWAVVLSVSFVVVNITDRMARTFLPLASLLDMSLVFETFTPQAIAEALAESDVGAARIILPGLAQSLASPLGQLLTRRVEVGPVCAAELPLFFGSEWTERQMP